jgi:hypothetical protein
MDGPDRLTSNCWFAGDLDDPWVVTIAEALPRDTFRIDCPADLPDAWPIDRPTPEVLVLHRSTLSPTDAQRIARLKARADRTPRFVLCVGPQARYVEVERWSRLVDVLLPEATARDSVARHALEIPRATRPPGLPCPRVAIISANHEWRATLADAARLGGFAVEPVAQPLDAPPGVAIAWDVPVLEVDWPDRMASLATFGPVVALLGFADRATVTLARSKGARVCLDMPCDVGDFLAALDRVATFRLDPPHAVPPPPRVLRLSPARSDGITRKPG